MSFKNVKYRAKSSGTINTYSFWKSAADIDFGQGNNFEDVISNLSGNLSNSFQAINNGVLNRLNGYGFTNDYLQYLNSEDDQYHLFELLKMTANNGMSVTYSSLVTRMLIRYMQLGKMDVYDKTHFKTLAYKHSKNGIQPTNTTEQTFRMSKGSWAYRFPADFSKYVDEITLNLICDSPSTSSTVPVVNVYFGDRTVTTPKYSMSLDEAKTETFHAEISKYINYLHNDDETLPVLLYVDYTGDITPGMVYFELESFKVIDPIETTISQTITSTIDDHEIDVINRFEW